MSSNFFLFSLVMEYANFHLQLCFLRDFVSKGNSLRVRHAAVGANKTRKFQPLSPHQNGFCLISDSYTSAPKILTSRSRYLFSEKKFFRCLVRMSVYSQSGVAGDQQKINVYLNGNIFCFERETLWLRILIFCLIWSLLETRDLTRSAWDLLIASFLWQKLQHCGIWKFKHHRVHTCFLMEEILKAYSKINLFYFPNSVNIAKLCHRRVLCGLWEPLGFLQETPPRDMGFWGWRGHAVLSADCEQTACPWGVSCM